MDVTPPTFLRPLFLQFFLHSLLSFFHESEIFSLIVHQNFGRVVMLLGALCENFIHETEDKIRHKAIQTALSFLFSAKTYFKYGIQILAYLYNNTRARRTSTDVHLHE
jgi:hypothetical protein